MQTVLINYTLEAKPDRNTMLEDFAAAAKNKFKGMPGLHSKVFCYDEKTGNGMSIYLWETKEHADRFFTSDFPAHFHSIFGTEPTITFHNPLVVVDNRAGDVLLN